MSEPILISLSIGQSSTTVSSAVPKGVHSPVVGMDSNTLVLKNKKRELVTPDYTDTWNPALYPRQKATVMSNGQAHMGIMFHAINDGYNNKTPILTNEGTGTTRVFKKYDQVIYDSVARPGSINVTDDDGVLASYNTKSVTFSTFYRAFVKNSKVTRLELWAAVDNQTGMVLKPTESLEFKITDPGHVESPYHDDGVRLESVSAAAAFSSSKTFDAAEQTQARTVGQLQIFKVPVRAINPGKSNVIISVYTGEAIKQEPLFWYSINQKTLQWGYRLNIEASFPAGTIYVLDEDTCTTLNPDRSSIPMSSLGDPIYLKVGTVNSQTRCVSTVEKMEDKNKTTTYVTPEDKNGEARTIYTLAVSSKAKVTPAGVKRSGHEREYPANTTIVVEECVKSTYD